MKIIKYLGIILLSAGLGFFGNGFLENAMSGNVEWSAYFEELLAPNITMAITTVGTLLTAAMPIFNKISKSGESFVGATKDLKTSIKNGADIAESISKYAVVIEGLVEENKTLKSEVENLTKMVKMGFCNNAELVKNGYAELIAEVGDKDVNA